jgi:uncharacterized protein (TIGR04255 family)
LLLRAYCRGWSDRRAAAILVFKTCLILADRIRVPLASLPEPDTALLPQSPLELVVCQIRYEPRSEVSNPRVALAFHAALGGTVGEYPRMDTVGGQAINVEVGPGGPAVTRNDGLTGWRYQSTDGAWIVSLMPDHLALESRRSYPGWEEFSTRLDSLIEVLGEELGPAVEQRTGLRYIDQITTVQAASASEWARYLAPEVLGLAAHEVLGEHVLNARQQLLLDLGEGHGCVLNHGFVPDDNAGRLGYALDFDVFRDGARAFDPAAVRDTLSVLHTDALKLFRASITDELYEVFRA